MTSNDIRFPRMLCFNALSLIWLTVRRDSQEIYAQDMRASIEEDFGSKKERRSLQVRYQDPQAPLIEDVWPLMGATWAQTEGRRKI